MILKPVMRPAMRSPMGSAMLARAILRSFAPNASSYSFSTLQGAYQDTGAITPSVAVNDPIGLQQDTVGTNNATQTTAINRPTVQRGLWNLLAYSQAFNTGWYLVRCSIHGGYSDPYGGLLAYKLIENSSSDSHTLLQPGVTTISGMKYSQAIFAKAGERSIVQVSSTNGVFTTFNLSSATVTGGSGSMLAIGGGWYLCTANYTAVVSGPDTTFLWPIASGTTNNYPGDGVSGLYIYMAGWFQGTLTADQILQQGGIPLTTSAAGSNPTAGPYWASFNGTNQSMALASVPFQMADDFAVVACVKYGTPVTWSTIFSLSGSGTTPRIQLLLNEVNGFALAYFQDDAGVNTQAQGAVDLSNTTSVITLAKRGTNVYLRVNGVQVATTSVAGLGAATFTAAAIGMLALGADYMLGGSYGVDLIKGTVTDAQLLVLEKAAAQKAGLVL